MHGLLGSLVLLSTANAAANLAPNASFEAGAEAPGSWDAFRPAGARLSRDANVARSGNASARIDSDAEGAKEYPNFRYTVRDVKPGEVYRASAWALNREMTDIGAYLTLEPYSGAQRGTFASSDFATASTDQWRHLSVRLMVGEGEDSLVVCLVAHGEGTVWFDDVELVRESEAPPESGATEVTLRLRPRTVVCPRFYGFGAQGDYFLTRSCNTSKGVDDADRKLVLDRVAAMRPALIRTFFDYQWWEPEEGRQTPDSEAMRDYVGWVRFLGGIGTSVLLCPWGDYFAYPAWMRDGEQRLPHPDKRDAMVRSLVDLVAYLRRTEGLDDVRFLCLMNEPDSAFPVRPTPLDEYVRLNRLLDRMLRDRGLRDEVFLLGLDECQSGPLEVSDWFRTNLARESRCYDGLSVHTYRHRYTPAFVPWFAGRQHALTAAQTDGRWRPILITESGYGGGTFDNPENGKYEYGLWMADFAVTALREGAAAVLTWCLFDTYYTDELAQHWGLWQYKDHGWEPRPGFYAWSLLTRYTRAGSRVIRVDAVPSAPSLRATALLSPDGKLTVLIVNRYPRPITVRLTGGPERTLREYVYSAESIPTPDQRMIPPSGTLRAWGTEALVVAPQSFVLFTDAG
ncbi:MAG: hypothetical protein FJX75_05330 [Armatimonadetes bacterium]|nr:hypothetical protein [Armatimonadota bacterium]